MKIHKVTKNGREAFCLDYSVGGKRVRKFFVTEEEAKRHLDRLEKEASKYGKVYAAMPPHERQEMVGLWMKLKASKISLAQILEQIEGVQNNCPFAGQATTDCLDAKRKAGVSARYLKQLTHTFNQFTQAFASSRLCDIPPASIEEWASRGGKLAPSTVKSRLSDAATLYSYAERQGWLPQDRNPCRKIEPRQESAPEPGILRVKAAAKLMRAAERRDPGLCCWLALSLFCGIRPAEVVKLKKSDILIDQKMAVVGNDASKTRRRRLVAIPDNALSWIKVSGIQTRPRNLRRRFDRLRKRVGLFRGWPHDAMRHSAASYHIAMHENAPMTALQMGHSVDVLHRHYKALVTKKDAEAFYAIRPNATI